MRSPLAHLSLRYKIPLRVIGLVVLTAAAVTAVIVARQVGQARADLDRYSLRLSAALANTLLPYLRNDDIWRAYEIVRATANAGSTPDAIPTTVIVTGAGGRVFVSSRPYDFPVNEALGSLGADFAALEQRMLRQDAAPYAFAADRSDRLFYAAPIRADDVLLGEVVMVASRAELWPRYREIMANAALVTLGVLALLLPASWVWGGRTGKPLVKLADAMNKVPARLDAIEADSLSGEGDEIGDLTRTFRRMLADLRRKQELEDQVMVSERLAAIGRLSAGIAHEINNPLGGMLNAISTHRKHGHDDPLTTRTLALLERGLAQIRDSVGALLVETKLADRVLTREDIDDVLLLAAAEVHRKHGRIEDDIALDTPVPLPAHQVRRILLNLLLNAAHAIEDGGTIGIVARAEDSLLRLRVRNSGAHIPADKLQYLFEPFALAGSQGSGLGLWVVYQIVQQLGGALEVASDPGRTEFAIDLPVPAAAGATVTALSEIRHAAPALPD